MLVTPVRLGAFLFAALNLMTLPALAQMPPPGACFCLKQSVDNSNADMAARNAALTDARAALDQLDQQLASMRAQVDVNNPQAVAQFKQVLEQRDRLSPIRGGITAVVPIVVSQFWDVLLNHARSNWFMSLARALYRRRVLFSAWV